jgi:tetratricopeptide (TPR) repeat protein
VIAGTPSIGLAQRDYGERTVPTPQYFATINSYFYAGEYKRALDQFEDEWRGAIKTTQSRWIDSICYYTMMGECYYHMGELDKALEQYTGALRLYVAFPDWMVRVQFPPAVRPGMDQTQIPWGPTTRRAQLGQFPTKMLISQGRINNNDIIKHGGVVQQAMLFPIYAQEIIRCTALAIRRRAELLGPLSPFDPLSTEVLAALSSNPGLPNHWCQCWVDVQLGMALIAAGKQTEGITVLNRGMVAAGRFDHPMTAAALLELGQMALLRGDYNDAIRYFHEASISAVYYPDPGIVEEAFRYGAMAHLAANRKGIYPPLATAAQWAKAKDLRQLRASLLLAQAENLGVLGQTAQASAVLDEAQVTIVRRDMAAGVIGARLNFLRAMMLFQQRRPAQGEEALAAAMGYMQHGSHWLFQLLQVDRSFTAGQITPRGPITTRTAMEVYRELLRDPEATDWQTRPMDSLAVLMSPHSDSYEHWFLIALDRKEHETALEIADRARRHRFLSSLAMGGRLEALRWVLEAPERSLPRQAVLERQDLFARFPAYQKLSEQAQQLRTQLDAIPLVSEDTAAQQKQRDLLTQLAALSAQQEAILREMAVRRELVDLVFPPVRPIKEVQAGLPPGQVLLDFFQAKGELYGFLLNKERYSVWRVKSTPMLIKQIVAMLRLMGHHDGNRELTFKELTDASWKQSAQQVLNDLLDGSEADFTTEFPELVVVPDGVLWYVPFEALQVKLGNQSRPLISRFRIRYAPTASLAVPASAALAAENVPTVVVLGRLYPRDEPAVGQAAFEDLSKTIPRCMALSKPPLPAPSAAYASLMRRLIVWDDLNPAEQGVYAWSPIQIERGKPGNLLADWFSLPWGGPEVILLPGFHTAAENSLKRVGAAAPGSEVFLTVCGLMSTGAKTLLISRWRTGGQISRDLVREFTQELPHSPPADAWQRAVLVAADTRLDPEAEPRLQRAADENPPKATHPFFWAGYMLVDRGVGEPPPEEPAKAAEPPLKLKPADAPPRPGAPDKPALGQPAEPPPVVEERGGDRPGSKKRTPQPRPESKKRTTSSKRR